MATFTRVKDSQELKIKPSLTVYFQIITDNLPHYKISEYLDSLPDNYGIKDEVVLPEKIPDDAHAWVKKYLWINDISPENDYLIQDAFTNITLDIVKFVLPLKEKLLNLQKLDKTLVIELFIYYDRDKSDFSIILSINKQLIQILSQINCEFFMSV